VKITLRGRDGDLSVMIPAKTNALAQKIVKAIQLTAGDVADEIKNAGDADMLQAGRFGRRWTDAFDVVAVEDGLNSKVTVGMGIPYWRVFQFGATIKGNPMLWIPLSGTDAVGLRARDFASSLGGLFHVTRKSDGLELLGSIRTKQMMYFGKASVTIPKKFHLLEICATAASNISTYFTRRLAGLRPDEFGD
jgi:hypothetical protein